MAKMIRCSLVMNTRRGMISKPIEFDSISDAVRFAKAGSYFAYRVFGMDGKLLRRGFCNS